MGNYMDKESEYCQFEFVCDQEWDSLSLTDNPKVRHCQLCDQDVILCHNLDELATCGAKKKCVCYAPWLNMTQTLGMLTSFDEN